MKGPRKIGLRRHDEPEKETKNDSGRGGRRGGENAHRKEGDSRGCNGVPPTAKRSSVQQSRSSVLREKREGDTHLNALGSGGQLVITMNCRSHGRPVRHGNNIFGGSVRRRWAAPEFKNTHERMSLKHRDHLERRGDRNSQKEKFGSRKERI